VELSAIGFQLSAIGFQICVTNRQISPLRSSFSARQNARSAQFLPFGCNRLRDRKPKCKTDKLKADS
jgi:hypothetical protein